MMREIDEDDVDVHRLTLHIIRNFLAISLTAVRMGSTTSLGIGVLLWRVSLSFSMQTY